MKNTTKTVALGLASLSVLATLAMAQGRAEQHGQVGEPGQHARRGAEARFERHAGRHGGRFAQARKFVRELELTDAQRDLARQEAQLVGPAARAAREEARAIVQAARARAQGGDREGARAEAREQLKLLRERTRAEFTPHGRALIQSLTPEQRARIDARLAERGKTFDVDKASERVGRWLARPRVQERAREHAPNATGTGR
ncbi:MAG: hypothetical protein NTY35_15275 [Planctomycetota bacterium]|nr:hypothetical protein [Planctomycetota bacterium]